MESLIDKIFLRAEEAFVPLSVHFDLTYRCNLHCIHCYIPEKERHPSASYREELREQNRTDLATQEVFNILDQLADCGTLFLDFSGGEIFVRSDIMDILSYSMSKRFSVSLMITGTIGFNENTADRLSDIGIQSVDISLYSAEPEVHESITRVPGSFNKTMKAIELLKERKINTRIKCPIMKTNVRTYKSLVPLAESYGVDWMLDPGITIGKDGYKNPANLRINDDELKEYYSFIMETIKINKEKELNEKPAPKCDDILDVNPCGASHSSCYISPYGDIQPCIEIPINCGNLREKSFKDLWTNSEEMLMVRGIKRKDLRNCLDCPNPDYCHRCIGQAYTESGDLFAPSEEFCRNIKIRNQARKES
jgi:radical SAM protein with 4Fe4S-binding SPASM domain